MYQLIPNSYLIPPPTPVSLLVTISLFSMSVSLSVRKSILERGEDPQAGAGSAGGEETSDLGGIRGEWQALLLDQMEM